MPKKSVPSKTRLIQDVRYFESANAPKDWIGFPKYAGTIFQIPNEATSIGQRIGRRCSEIGLSIGYSTHLYLCFTSAEPENKIVLTNFSAAPWHRFASYGLSHKFNSYSNERKLKTIVDATFEVLELIGSTAIKSIECVKEQVKDEDFLFFVKSKQFKNYVVSIYHTIPAHPRRAEVFAEITNTGSDETRKIKIGSADFYFSVSKMVDRIVISKGVLSVLPKNSYIATIITSMNAPLTPVDLQTVFVA